MAVLTLLYHDIVKADERCHSGFQGADADIYKLDPDEFRHHLTAISRVKSLTMTEGAAHTPNFERCLITIDDGGAGTWHAAELLEEFGWRGYFFVVSEMIAKPGFLNEAQIAELHRRGHIIGSHSSSHPDRMSSCSVEQLRHEWGNSVRRISEIVNSPVTTASVPCGFYSQQVGIEASRAGIRTLFTSEPITSTHLVNGCTVVGRFMVQEGVPAQWVASLVGGDLSPRVNRYLSWNSKKVLKTVGGNLWLAVRRKILAARAYRAA